jgi:hypothetical protein
MKLIDGVYKVLRREPLPSEFFVRSLKEIHVAVLSLISKYGEEANLREFTYPGDFGFEVEYIDNATPSENHVYKIQLEKANKATKQKEKQERALYEKLKKKYENG